jgi:hypothetical protein
MSESLNLIITREREREREEVHGKCTVWFTVHFIITLFKLGNVLLCVIYELNFTVFVYVTQHHAMYSVRYYTRFDVTAVRLGTYYMRIWGSVCIYCEKSIADICN